MLRVCPHPLSRHVEYPLKFSCPTRGFCPSCHAKRLEEWRNRMPRIFLNSKLRLLDELCRSALRSVELNLTSLLAEIYALSGWIKRLATSKRFARQARPKSRLLYL